MHNDKEDSNAKNGSLDGPKTNEDFNKKRPRLGSSGLKRNLPSKKSPLFGASGKKPDPEPSRTKPFPHNEGDLGQANNSADSETPIDNSDSLGVPITGKKAGAGK